MNSQYFGMSIIWSTPEVAAKCEMLGKRLLPVSIEMGAILS